MQRFWSKVRKTDSCWLWEAGKNSRGYGSFWYNGKTLLAHRVAYVLTHGAIPDGKHVCHSCDNPVCVNPAHLWPGTDADNMHDASIKGRIRSVAPMAVRNRAKTHCLRGHEFAAGNAGVRKSRKGRYCKACLVERFKQRRAAA